MRKPVSTQRVRVLALTAMVASSVIVAGCTGAPLPTTATNAAPQPTSSPTESGIEVPDRVPDPHSLRGHSEAKAVDGIEPIATKPAPTLPATVTGDDGVTVTVESIDRIVTLDIYGTTSQTLIGLGLEDNIVGRTISDIDARIDSVPVVSEQGHAVDVELVLAQQPTLVLADTTLGPQTAVQLLRESGIDVVVLSPDRAADLIAPQIEMIAAATGVPEIGAQLIERTNQELKRVQQYIQGLRDASGVAPLRMAVLYVRGNGGVFFIFGKGSAASELIVDLGAIAVADEGGLVDTAPANAESLITIDPEIVLVMNGGLESTGGITGLLDRPGMSQTTAGANQRVVSAPDSQLISFGPNYPAALKALADAVYLG